MDGDTAPAPGAPQPGQPTAPPAPQPPAGPAPATPPQDVASLPDWAQKIISDTRAEAAQHRTAGKTATQQAQAAQAQRDAILKALGFTPDGKEAPPDPEKLAKQIDDYKSTAWENATQVAILRVSALPAVGADADALLDSNSFLDSLVEFVDDDPTTPEFRTRLSKHIKDFVKDNPKFKATPAGPTRSGGEFPGGSGAGAPITEDQLQAMTPTQIATAYNDGKLTHLM